MDDKLALGNGVRGAVVTVDPRLVQQLAINLLDEEPDPMPTPVDRSDSGPWRSLLAEEPVARRPVGATS